MNFIKILDISSNKTVKWILFAHKSLFLPLPTIVNHKIPKSIAAQRSSVNGRVSITLNTPSPG